MAGNDKPDQFTEKVTGWAWVIGVLICVMFLVWYFHEDTIRNWIRWLRYAEMWVISPFIPNSYEILYKGSTTVNFSEWLAATPDIPRENLDNQTLDVLTHLALDIMKWPATILISLLGFWVFTMGPGTSDRTRYDLNGFIRRQAKMFPAIAPVVDFDPGKQPARPPGSPIPAELPHFAEALGPEEWLAYNGVSVPDGKVDRDSAKRSFVRQLGPRWKGSKNLKPYKQVLLAACCLKASRKRTECDDLLGRLAQCWSLEKGLDFKADKKLLPDARKVLITKDLAAATLKKCNQHAWQTTAMIRALMHAREEGGVLAPAQFVWLRSYDRTLWYPLNNLGRQALHMEALGAMAHFKAEKLARRPIPRAKVEGAVNSIADYMASDIARPIPQLDYSNSKKRGVKKAKMT